MSRIVVCSMSEPLCLLLNFILLCKTTSLKCGLHVILLPLHREEVDELAKRLKLKLFRTSVKENFNVDQGNEY